MRLWHKDLISVLPRQQLLGQWRECCAIAKSMKEKGTPNHILVNKVMDYPKVHFIWYSYLIHEEMKRRGYQSIWSGFMDYLGSELFYPIRNDLLLKDWHNDQYLNQCLANLQEKHDCGGISDEEWQKITDKYPKWR